MPRTKEISVLKKLPPISVNSIMYVLLLVSFFLLGYLFAKVQTLEGGTTGATGTPAQAQTPPAAPGQPVPGQKVDVGIGHFPVKGDKDAKVTIVEFADFRCPFCEKFYTDVEPQLIKDYVDTGKAKFAFRHYEFLGAASVMAGNAAECANEQGKFWEMYDYFYKNQPPETDTSMYTVDKLTEVAGQLGLNTDQFNSCLSANKYQKNVDQDLAEGQQAGVSGTPTFFINGEMLVGAQPYESFKAIIDKNLQ